MTPIEVAKKFLNQAELTGNKFKDDPNVVGDLGELLKKAGHKDGEAWCCYLMEVVFCEALPDKEAKLRKLFSASCTQTLKNFKAAGYFISDKPIVGALAIWVNVKDGVEQWTGHAGICTAVVSATQFKSIEGNTNSDGGREGKFVLPKSRTVARVKNGLQVKAFIVI